MRVSRILQKKAKNHNKPAVSGLMILRFIFFYRVMNIIESDTEN